MGVRRSSIEATTIRLATPAWRTVRPLLVVVALGGAIAGFAHLATAQDAASTLTQQITVLSASPPPAAQEELPGMGHKFELIGSAADDQDPDNLTNDVISTELDLVSNFFGGALRRLPPGIKIAALDNQVNLKYRFDSASGRNCFGGSPRVSLFVDANGDGQFTQPPDFVAQGHVNPPLFAACLQDEWRIEDLSDDLKRWETTPLVTFAPPSVCGPVGAVTTCTWDELEARVTATFPNHQVFAGGLIDDTFGGPGQTGIAHYDLLTIENRTLENDQDTVP